MSDSNTSLREALRRDSRCIRNRLLSIHCDARFVNSVSEALPGLPVLPNERCGSWYVQPKSQTPNGDSVYFKSTDGHFGNWDFNLRRLNRHLLTIIEKHHGCIIVDSTRHGKRIPDSLSKTIPIWCATINTHCLALNQHHQQQQQQQAQHGKQPLRDWDTVLHTPPGAVSRGENSQIEALIPNFASKITFPIPTTSKPLRPLWVHPQASTPPPAAWTDASLPFHPLVLVSASMCVPDGFERREGWCYVQGSADDHEMWAQGLTPDLFWEHAEALVSTSTNAECEAMVRSVVASSRVSSNPRGEPFSWIGETGIAIGDRRSGEMSTCWESFGAVVNCGVEMAVVLGASGRGAGGPYLFLPIDEGKRGQKALFECLETAILFILAQLKAGRKVLVHCEQGRDRSVAVVTAFLVAHMLDSEELCLKRAVERATITKKVVSDRLLFIQRYRQMAQPCRASLRRINLHFMGYTQGDG